MSEKGAWASHIWEQPVFHPEEEEDENTGVIEYAMPGTENYSPDFPFAQSLQYFQNQALDKLRNTYDPPTDIHLYGLGQLQNSPTPEDQGWQGHLFDVDSNPQVFAFIPYVTIWNKHDPNYGLVDPTGLPAAWDKPGAPGPRADQNGVSFNDQIESTLQSIFGQTNLPIQRVLYAPDIDGDPLDESFETSRGRAKKNGILWARERLTLQRRYATQVLPNPGASRNDSPVPFLLLLHQSPQPPPYLLLVYITLQGTRKEY
ncbi:hypothetical protein F5Y10DRAFT_273969 [Nemania abortiva]|nr:hypothetical protein F5Y10DRAFT_273969 [Nemania abortiva]